MQIVLAPIHRIGHNIAMTSRCDEGKTWNPFPELCVWGAVDPTGFANGMRWGWTDCTDDEFLGDDDNVAWEDSNL